MRFGEAVSTVLRKYADFDGRATIPEFWWWFLFNVLAASAFSVFDGVVLGGHGHLGALYALAVLVPNLAVTVRRLRDADYSWAHIFWVLLPFVGFLVLLWLCTHPTRRLARSSAAPGRLID